MKIFFVFYDEIHFHNLSEPCKRMHFNLKSESLYGYFKLTFLKNIINIMICYFHYSFYIKLIGVKCRKFLKGLKLI